MIFIDVDTEHNTTWQHIATAGNYQRYQGRATPSDITMRWGCNHSRSRFPEGVRVLNRRIILSKLEQGALFQENNVPFPKVYNSRLSWERDSRPQLLVKPDIGQMGTGVRLISSPRWERDKVYQRYIDKQREFRAMMVGDLMAFFMEKHRPANGDIRWNEHRGSEWTGVGEERGLRPKVKEIGSKAVKALGYDFGAVDIIMDGEGKLYALEVNSRPEFGEVNAQRFVRALEEYLR
jgi:glutathione synthase/RimK-type ligase-like ATP-grasp enzyme